RIQFKYTTELSKDFNRAVNHYLNLAYVVSNQKNLIHGRLSNMKCPACNRTLSAVEVGNIEVDVCKDGCGGIWFDRFELDKVDEPQEKPGEELLNMPRGNPDSAGSSDDERPCPQCDDIIMRQFFFTVKKEVEVDECPSCGSAWVDAGELSTIRDQFESDEARDQAFQEKINEKFGDQLKQDIKQAEQTKETGTSVAKTVKFLLPSYWIPGEQGGAF
ncbi:MAG: zf-TFIIB domain-containing protein, partial [bacterium]